MEATTTTSTPYDYIHGIYESILALPAELKKRTIDMTETIGDKIDAFGRAFRGEDQDSNSGDIFIMLSQHHAFIEGVRKSNPILYCTLVNAAACWKNGDYTPIDTLKCGNMQPMLSCSQFADKANVVTFVVNLILIHNQVEKQEKSFIPSQPLLDDLRQKSTSVMSPEEVDKWIIANVV